MFAVDRIIFLTGALLLVGILSSKISVRMGLPVLLLFLLVGMLAGSEGIGRIDFDNFEIAHAIGTIALAAILFDGGLQTPLSSIRAVWKPSLLLATIGVLVTAAVTGVAASYILNIPLLDGLLLGSIVGSTDAAAVFAVLRSQGLRLHEHVSATLEIESGSNDPMAIFLTIGLIEVLLGRMSFGPELLNLFLLQMVVGAAVGLALGWLAVRFVNRISLDSAGLYPVLTGACGLIVYGLAVSLGGSGYLAIYLFGIMLGNSQMVFQRGSQFFHSALAWIGQISMFVVLGLLCTPSEVFAVSWQGLLISAVLIFIARPVAVVPLLLPFGFNAKEITFISWVGLKGAVPIILATFPPLFGVPEGSLMFNVVFFVVLVSAVLQGWTLPFFANRLGLQSGRRSEAPVSIEIVSIKKVDAAIVEYTIEDDSRAAGKKLRDIALPDGVVVALISRGTNLIPPRGSTTVLPGDHVFTVLQPAMRPMVDRTFGAGLAIDKLPKMAEYPLRGNTTVGNLRDVYGVELDAPAEKTLDELLRDTLKDRTAVGAEMRLDNVKLSVRKMEGDRITCAALSLLDPENSLQTMPRPTQTDDAA
jgi:cell volume regulation protein A